MNRGLAWPWHWTFARARRIKNELLRRVYIDRSRNPADSIIVAGTARSGSSWLADTLASATGAHVVFEPFNTGTVSESRIFGEFPYRREDDKDDRLTAFCHKVLSGQLRGPWVDRSANKIFPRGRVVKVVRANLMLGWLRRNFPGVPLIVVLRHPCAVTLSRTESNWSPEPDMRALMSQPRFVDDELNDVMNVIDGVQTDAAKHAVIWSAHYRTALRQLARARVIVTSYELLCSEPEIELRRILEGLGANWSAHILRAALRPSATTQSTSAIITGKDKLRRWQTVMTQADINAVLTVVREFGMNRIYEDSAMPSEDMVRNIRANNCGGLVC